MRRSDAFWREFLAESLIALRIAFRYPTRTQLCEAQTISLGRSRFRHSLRYAAPFDEGTQGEPQFHAPSKLLKRPIAASALLIDLALLGDFASHLHHLSLGIALPELLASLET